MWIWEAVQLIAGIGLLIGGGDVLVRGAASLAKRLGLKTSVIGLTVVAFGTSAPELAVNIQAALSDSSEVSFGNILGSNVANLGLILGLACLAKPILIRRSIVNRELPMMLLASAAVFIMAQDQWLAHRGSGPAPAEEEASVGRAAGVPVGAGSEGSRAEAEGWGEAPVSAKGAKDAQPMGSPGQPAPWDGIDRSEGLILLLLFGIFCYYTINDILHQWQADAYLSQLPIDPSVERPLSLPWAVLYLTGGLVGLIAGGRLTVDGAVGIAELLAIPSEVIGFTVVAIGTSLPELAAALMAVRRGHPDLVVGNVVGSNLFNLLLVLAVTVLVRPIEVPERGVYDLWMMFGLSLVLMPVAMSGQNWISRWEGASLFLLYVGYLSWRAYTSVGLG